MSTLDDHLGATPPHVWLTSFWGFQPETWGCLGFTDPNARYSFIQKTTPGVLVAVYVTKNRGPLAERGNVVGILQVSHEVGSLRDFISGDQWARAQGDRDSRDKWLHALRATRAWRIIPEQWQQVDSLLPRAYNSAHAQTIGSSGVAILADEARRVLELEVLESAVLGAKRALDGAIKPLAQALTPSRAVTPASAPYTVYETDGPKHLYILKLTGDTAAYLGRPVAAVEDMSIIKVGYSKSPITRRNQIQSAYPHGAFHWEIMLPKDTHSPPPYPNAAVATEGEKAMKARLVLGGAESLGHEYFVAPEWLILQTWTAGRLAAEAATSS